MDSDEDINPIEYRMSLNMNNQPGQIRLIDAQDIIDSLELYTIEGDERRQRLRAMKPKKMNKALGFQLTITNGGECSICHNRVRKNSRMPMLKCEHYFHQKCLFNWIKIKGNCPVCRAKIPLVSRKK